MNCILKCVSLYRKRTEWTYKWTQTKLMWTINKLLHLCPPPPRNQPVSYWGFLCAQLTLCKQLHNTEMSAVWLIMLIDWKRPLSHHSWEQGCGLSKKCVDPFPVPRQFLSGCYSLLLFLETCFINIISYLAMSHNFICIHENDSSDFWTSLWIHLLSPFRHLPSQSRDTFSQGDCPSSIQVNLKFPMTIKLLLAFTEYVLTSGNFGGKIVAYMHTAP